MIGEYPDSLKPLVKKAAEIARRHPYTDEGLKEGLLEFETTVLQNPRVYSEIYPIKEVIEQFVPVSRLRPEEGSLVFTARTYRGSKYIEHIKDLLLDVYPMDSPRYLGLVGRYAWAIPITSPFSPLRMSLKIFIYPREYRGELPFKKIKIFLDYQPGQLVEFYQQVAREVHTAQESLKQWKEYERGRLK